MGDLISIVDETKAGWIPIERITDIAVVGVQNFYTPSGRMVVGDVVASPFRVSTFWVYGHVQWLVASGKVVSLSLASTSFLAHSLYVSYMHAAQWASQIAKVLFFFENSLLFFGLAFF